MIKGKEHIVREQDKIIYDREYHKLQVNASYKRFASKHNSKLANSLKISEKDYKKIHNLQNYNGFDPATDIFGEYEK